MTSLQFTSVRSNQLSWEVVMDVVMDEVVDKEVTNVVEEGNKEFWSQR